MISILKLIVDGLPTIRKCDLSDKIKQGIIPGWNRVVTIAWLHYLGSKETQEEK